MKNTFILCFFCISLCSYSQNFEPEGTTRAVIIGISDYQDEKIPDLRYAHKDAIAFANFLRSPAGGSLDEDQLKVLLNEQATAAQFGMALDWLWEVAQENDRVFIYFSGHGDVERKSITNPGYLLCWDSRAQVYMAGGAFNVRDLNDVISTISIKNKAQVILIADACRAGKLAGSEIGGAQATAANLAKQFANEIKILSCQPDEFSIEGKQWGAGRGAFSYHLIDGLYGMADGNDDLTINLKEIDRYLEDHVSDEVAPQSQNPVTVGNKTERITEVFPEILTQLKEGRKSQLQLFAATDQRGIEDEVLAQTDSNIIEIYLAFKQSLEDKVFLQPADSCADFYYRKLIHEPQLERLHSTMKRNYAAALQDDAQQAINALLSADRDYLVERWFVKNNYSYPKYLQRAAELLGPSHYFYSTLQANQFYFESWNLIFSLEGENPVTDSLKLVEGLDKLKKAISIHPNAAYLHEGLANIYKYHEVRDIDSAFLSLQKAIELSPTWPIPYYEMARIYSIKEDIDASEKWYYKAIEVDSTFFGPYSRLAAIYRLKNQPEKAILTLNKALQIDSTDYYTYFSLAAAFLNQKKLEEAIRVYLKLAPHLPEKEKVISEYNMHLLDTYLAADYLEEAKIHCQKMLDMKRDSAMAFAGLGFIDLYNGKNSTAWDYFNLAAELSDDTYYRYLNFTSFYAMTGEIKKALELLKTGLENGNRDFFWITTSKSFDPLRMEPVFQSLMQKYFPNRIKK